MKKGISEIVASLMMIVIVVGVGMALYTYSMGYFSVTASALGETSKVNINSVRERFTVVDVILEAEGGETHISAAVYNYGKTSIILKALFINGTMATVSESVEIPPNDWAWFNGTVPALIPAGSLCYIRVVSEMGNFYEELVVS